jgi:hypothetical protein
MVNSLRTKEAEKYTKAEFLIILHEYLQEQVELSLRKSKDEENFKLPSWSEYQAFQLGLQKAYQKVTQFLPDPVTNFDN